MDRAAATEGDASSGRSESLAETVTVGDPTEAAGRSRRVSPFDLPTPEKRAFGDRMRRARETAGLNQVEASERLGYSQAVQLSNIEAGNRLPPIHMLIAAADLYQTTADYLCGLTPEPDRDPFISCQTLVAQRVAGEVRSLIGTLIESNARVLRQLRADSAAVARLAGLALETQSALQRLRQANPEFDDMRAGAVLLHKAELAASAAAAIVETHLQAGIPGTSSMTSDAVDAAVITESLAVPRLGAIRAQHANAALGEETASNQGHA
jgi:transcriptional regulator with XRE-family HTH domain